MPTLRPLPLLLAAIFVAAASPSPIPSPSRHDRIAIVGAGPAGLHMAYLLQRLEYRNVVLLDARSRVGGRTVTVADSDGVTHELAACYVNSEYDDLRRLAEWAGYPYETVTLPEGRLEREDGAGVKLIEFVVGEIVRLLQLRDGEAKNLAETARWHLDQAAKSYEKLWKDALPDSDFEFPLKPPALNATIDEFLRDNQLLALRPIFQLGMTSMGYGHPADTAAEYGLMWMTPGYVNDIIGVRQNSTLGMLKNGFQPIWDQVRRSLQADFRLGVKVTGVRTLPRGRVKLSLSNGDSLTADWVVWTANLGVTFNLLSDLLDSDERSLFSSLTARKFRTQLVEFNSGQSPHPDSVTYFLENLASPEPDFGSLWAVRNSSRALGLSARGASGHSSLVTYFLSDFGQSGLSEVERLPDGRVRMQRDFLFQPRFSVRHMADGSLQRLLLRMQGRRRVWYAGHSAVFDSVKSVMKYNKMLLRLAFPDRAGKIRGW